MILNQNPKIYAILINDEIEIHLTLDSLKSELFNSIWDCLTQDELRNNRVAQKNFHEEKDFFDSCKTFEVLQTYIRDRWGNQIFDTPIKIKEIEIRKSVKIG